MIKRNDEPDMPVWVLVLFFVVGIALALGLSWWVYSGPEYTGRMGDDVRLMVTHGLHGF